MDAGGIRSPITTIRRAGDSPVTQHYLPISLIHAHTIVKQNHYNNHNSPPLHLLPAVSALASTNS